MSTGLLLTVRPRPSSWRASIRFLTLAEGSIRSGLEKLPPHLDEAARSLGRTSLGSARSGASCR
jgi:iron(III) transport system permease protein